MHGSQYSAWAEMTSMSEITGQSVLCRMIWALQKDLLLGNREGPGHRGCTCTCPSGASAEVQG